ncbi:hypothetical protein ACVIYL_001578 [Bradyrhizobium sp. USDA 3315]
MRDILRRWKFTLCGGFLRLAAKRQQYREILGDILSVIRARFVGDSKFGAQERRTEFRNQLLGAIGLVGKALAFLAVQAMGTAAKMRRQFMWDRGIETLLR